jgi:CHAT domain-containing protein/tetratricopeptide (TPR) repeat protein
LIQKSPNTNLQLLIAFILAGVLSVALDSSAFCQDKRGASQLQSAETASRAEALLQNALRWSGDGDIEPVRRQVQEALGMWTQIHEPVEAAKASSRMGDRCKEVRKYKDALSYYRQALDTRSLPPTWRANALNAIGRIYADLYVSDLAMRYFDLALKQASIVNDLSAQTVALTGMGDIHRQQGALDKAWSLITKALLLRNKYRAGPDPSLLYLKGRVNQARGLIANAKDAFEAALVIHRNAGNDAGQVRILCALSTLYSVASQKQAALERAEQAVKLSEKEIKLAVSFADFIDTGELQWSAYLSRARAECGLGLRDRALKSYSRAIDHFEGLWWTNYIATEASAVAFREEAQAAYREYVDLLIEEEKFKEAYEVADNAKARTLLNFGGARRARQRSEDTVQAGTLRELSRSAVNSRMRLRASALNSQQRAKAQHDLKDAEYQIEEIRLQTEMEHVRERQVWSQLANVAQLEEQMAGDDKALVEFSLGEKRSFVWLLTGGEVYFETLKSRKEIEKVVKLYLEKLAAPPNQLNGEKDLAKLKEQSEALFDILFGGLARLIKPEQRLIVVPDGLLHYLPIEALIHNGHYLVEDHTISYLPSAGMLNQLQDSKAQSETGDKMELLAFGDPIFGLEMKASGSGKPRSRRIDVVRDALGSPGFRLPSLPRTRDEVNYIASLFPAERTRLYLGKDSTEDAFKRESLRRYRRLHFATHSLIDEVSPSRSAVVLTLDNSPDEDGFLDVYEISELDLDCDLVVLSACQTGRGALLSGEGIVGLSRAFMYAGARSLVVSLWSVSDISTGHLMKSFYQHLKGNLGNAAALRSAKLQMLHGDTATRHPYYWASFIAIGKP